MCASLRQHRGAQGEIGLDLNDNFLINILDLMLELKSCSRPLHHRSSHTASTLGRLKETKCMGTEHVSCLTLFLHSSVVAQLRTPGTV